MRPPRFARSRRSDGPGSTRFAKTFARRPLTPRVTSLPDRRAWMTTAFVTTFVAGAAVAVPILTHLGGGKSDTIVSVDAPLTSRTTTTPTATPTSTPTTGPEVTRTTTVTGEPRVSVATATVTVTAPGGQETVVRPGTTVTLPPTTTTVTAPGKPLPPPAPLTATTTVTTKVTEKVEQPQPMVQKDPDGVQPMPNAPARLRSDGAARCVDVKDGRAGAGTDGTPLQVWDCHDAGGQIWSFKTDGTVRALDQCMDLAWGSIAENTPVQLVACNGSAAQQFRITNSNELVNPAATGKCVTVDGGDNGKRLFLRTCTGAESQKWHRNATDADRKIGAQGN
ncbi:ricin-type beta-trefoil lectin protein [Kribbella amoyensis]|uniref:Ricin-type beta-trefoil lectin protein n=1 Tax=Kribbella amoyensis TaxID=996641 RepID=A0A561BQ08_9ACTN|nr:RICIN domain-containing protein [Kribbella amoyensis]TWD80912.1 ricin-type beta-trefoil lectin protein [Kribbella amoyensis]